jgi:hypothetical protein
LPRFEAWWEAHGFKWLKDRLLTGESPLAAHQTTTPAAKVLNNQSDPLTDCQTNGHTDESGEVNEEQVSTPSADTDIFADMLAELTDEVLEQKL